jgi:hypothetical protein
MKAIGMGAGDGDGISESAIGDGDGGDGGISESAVGDGDGGEMISEAAVDSDDGSSTTHKKKTMHYWLPPSKIPGENHSHAGDSGAEAGDGWKHIYANYPTFAPSSAPSKRQPPTHAPTTKPKLPEDIKGMNKYLDDLTANTRKQTEDTQIPTSAPTSSPTTLAPTFSPTPQFWLGTWHGIPKKRRHWKKARAVGRAPGQIGGTKMENWVGGKTPIEADKMPKAAEDKGW